MTVEDGPGNSNATRDPHTQDITPYWSSILSMIDLSYGLQPFAHNASGPSGGGFFNDMDVLE